MDNCILTDRPFSDVNHVGLAIQKNDFGFHSGFVYRLDGEDPRIIHLAFHHRLTDEPANDSYRWTDIGLDDDNKLIFATLLSRIAQINPKISYAFDSSGACFDETGEWNSLPIGKGLTCATFITAALRTYRYELVNLESWPDREEDIEWQEKILSLLSQHADQEHVEAVRRDLGAKRLRPDEVVGAGTVTDIEWPVQFETARNLADQIVSAFA